MFQESEPKIRQLMESFVIPFSFPVANTMVFLDDFHLRRDKLNSQFIVTKISILHAGGRSFFIFQTSRECWIAMLEPRNRRRPAL